MCGCVYTITQVSVFHVHKSKHIETVTCHTFPTSSHEETPSVAKQRKAKQHKAKNNKQTNAVICHKAWGRRQGHGEPSQGPGTQPQGPGNPENTATIFVVQIHDSNALRASNREGSSRNPARGTRCARRRFLRKE